MMTAAQIRAARALPGMGQRRLAEISGLSLPFIQCRETCDGQVPGNPNLRTRVVISPDPIP